MITLLHIADQIFLELLQPFSLSLAQSDVRSDVFQTRGRKAKVGGHISSSTIRAVGKSKIRGLILSFVKVNIDGCAQKIYKLRQNILYIFLSF